MALLPWYSHDYQNKHPHLEIRRLDILDDNVERKSELRMADFSLPPDDVPRQTEIGRRTKVTTPASPENASR